VNKASRKCENPTILDWNKIIKILNILTVQNNLK
jgi:hypothetical protein